MGGKTGRIAAAAGTMAVAGCIENSHTVPGIAGDSGAKGEGEGRMGRNGNCLIQVGAVDQGGQNVLDGDILSVSITVVSNNDGISNCLARVRWIVL